MSKIDAIKKRHTNSLRSPTVPGDLETALRTEKVLRTDRAILIDVCDDLVKALQDINKTIFGTGAPLHSEEYYQIRELAVYALNRADEKVT